MANSIDRTDLNILKILQEKGRITNLQLSSDIGLSPAPTLERVKKLERSGIIKDYHAVLNETKLGLGIQGFMQVTLSRHKSHSINDFVEQMNKIDAVVECYHITGAADFMLKIKVKDIEAYEKLLREKLSAVEEIAQMQTLMILSDTKLSRVLPINYDQDKFKAG